MATKREGVRCYENASADEPIFCLRAQDLLAPLVVEYWAMLAAGISSSEELRKKIEDAKYTARQMREWKDRKLPD